MDGKLDVNTQNGYDIATALRGPDNENYHLKVITTCVVRSLAGLELESERSAEYSGENVSVSTGGAFMATPEQARKYWEKLSKDSKKALVSAPALHHHMGHTKKALVALGEEGKNHAAWLVEIEVMR